MMRQGGSDSGSSFELGDADAAVNASLVVVEIIGLVLLTIILIMCLEWSAGTACKGVAMAITTLVWPRHY